METLKKIIFTRRISAYNETFAPIGGNGPVFAMIWDETISGRLATDLISTYHSFIVRNGTNNEINFWLDNCFSQNKNWNLLAHLVLLVNSPLIQTKTVKLYYFEPGHGFNAADSFHHGVENAMKAANKVYTFPDFKECVENATNPVVVDMKYNDFFKTTVNANMSVIDKLRPRPLLPNFKFVSFTRGDYDIEYSEAATGENLRKIRIFSKEQLKTIQSKSFNLISTLKFNHEPVGIDKEKKETIVKNLLPMMPLAKYRYWTDLPVAKESEKCTKKTQVNENKVGSRNQSKKGAKTVKKISKKTTNKEVSEPPKKRGRKAKGTNQ